MSNTVFVAQDEAGLFILKGASKYRPTDSKAAGGLRPRSTTRAWPDNTAVHPTLKVDTPKGQRSWAKA